jgi:primosomal protein N'
MPSEKQLAANRANAQKSTGPNTKDGKEKSRLNAIRDNTTGQIITLPDRDRAVFEKLKAEHVASLAPQTIEETKLAEAVAWDTWRLDRLRANEMNIYALAAEDSADPDADDNDPEAADLHTAIFNARTSQSQAKRFELMSLYEQRMTRSLHRNRQALRELQAERRRNRERDKGEEIILARFQDLKDLPYQAPEKPSPNGSVFSNEEITLAAERQRNLEATMYLLSTKAPWVKFGATGAGSPDLFAELPYRAPPDALPKKIHGVSPESIALRTFYHPEEFERRRR